jgi:hypothetical protein
MSGNEFKLLRATISVEWGYENHSITLTAKNWAKIKAGKPHSQRGAGYMYESIFFWDYWSFGGGMDGELKVGYSSKDEGYGGGFEGKLSDAEIREHLE